MNWLDIVILVIMVASLFLGLKVGIIRTVLSLAGLAVGIFLAGRYYIPLAQWLAFIRQTTVAEIIAFVIILVGVMIIASLLARLLRWITSAIMLGWIDHLGGAIFGLVWGAILCGALLALWLKFAGGAEAIRQSSMAIILLDRFNFVLLFLPGEFQAIRSFFR